MYGEDRNYRFLIGIGAVIIMLFIAIFLIVRSGGNDARDAEVQETKRELTSYVGDDNASVSFKAIGPVTAPADHGEMVITVDNGATTVEFMQGYDGNVVASRTYYHSTQAFSEFLYALQGQGYTLGDDSEELADDKGFCPTGNRYIFSIQEGTDTVQRYWTTTCRGTKTFKGDTSDVIDLFYDQIPDDFDDILDAAGVTDDSIYRF